MLFRSKIYDYKKYFDNIVIKIPSPEDYIHKCLINVASFSWKNAYLFNNKNLKDSEYQNNLNIIEENIKIIIKKTFRDFIPFDEIFEQINDYINSDIISKKSSNEKNNKPDKPDKPDKPEIKNKKDINRNKMKKKKSL